ncbi:hypothetical protein [Leptothoe sp. PORK10 BA2]|uniref:hypothetical protein n=1 Tax=Leptothoe sp. PORK10 BA2 TaxID=3110254 RepID=UPI002B1F63CF|nr:hypothetical protein [Leptothoe sp. PORK10 BA2]MEA5466497.1 hypothetical protein [Leptothoe sp. PORK10 BA2]
MDLSKVLSWALPQALILALPLSLMSNLAAAAWATKADLTVFPSLDSQEGTCPETVVAYETLRPYTEGGSTTDGMIQLREISTNIRVSQVDDFSVTWVGTLKPQYANCEATASIVSWDGEDFQDHSYIRVQISNGQVKAILDMTGVADANGFTSVILYQGMREGNPRWTWGGTD